MGILLFMEILFFMEILLFVETLFYTETLLFMKTIFVHEISFVLGTSFSGKPFCTSRPFNSQKLLLSRKAFWSWKLFSSQERLLFTATVFFMFWCFIQTKPLFTFHCYLKPIVLVCVCLSIKMSVTRTERKMPPMRFCFTVFQPCCMPHWWNAVDCFRWFGRESVWDLSLLILFGVRLTQAVLNVWNNATDKSLDNKLC